jgi:hypothetical protein
MRQMRVSRDDLGAHLVQRLGDPRRGKKALDGFPARGRVAEHEAKAALDAAERVRSVDDDPARQIAEPGDRRSERVPGQGEDDEVRVLRCVPRQESPASGLGGQRAHRFRLGIAGAERDGVALAREAAGQSGADASRSDDRDAPDGST